MKRRTVNKYDFVFGTCAVSIDHGSFQLAFLKMFSQYEIVLFVLDKSDITIFLTCSEQLIARSAWSNIRIKDRTDVGTA